MISRVLEKNLRPSPMPKDVPQLLNNLILDAWKKEPESRPTSAQMLLKLTAICNGASSTSKRLFKYLK